jgi:hypothetical protein
MELLTFLPIFIAGLGCGFYLRDRIHSMRRARCLAGHRERRVDNMLSFTPLSMDDVGRALRDLPPLR